MRPPRSLRLLAIGGMLVLAGRPVPAAGLNPVPQIESSQPVPLIRPAASLTTTPLPDNYRLLYEQTFQQPSAIRDFVFTDPTAWRISQEAGAPALELATQSHYEPPVRSPVNIALIADRVFGNFILEAELLQTSREYAHRDLCLFFGFQNSTNFYYAHLASTADEHAHNVFLVKDAPRTKIARETTRGVNWGADVWHKVRLERQLASGAIRVFFDDLNRPIMVGEDKTFGAGYVGFGSFDDTGKIRNIRITGPDVERKPIAFFRRP